jgi:chromosome segregation ATPase
VQNAPSGRGEAVDQHRASYERSELHSQVQRGTNPAADENLRLRQELLVLRDELVGHEARLGEALGKIELLEIELRRYEDAMADAERLLSSRTGRVLRAWHRLRALLRA